MSTKQQPNEFLDSSSGENLDGNDQRSAAVTSDIFIGEHAKFQRKNRERGRRVQRTVPRLLDEH
jgi:hypothetical protein